MPVSLYAILYWIPRNSERFLIADSNIRTVKVGILFIASLTSLRKFIVNEGSRLQYLQQSIARSQPGDRFCVSIVPKYLAT